MKNKEFYGYSKPAENFTMKFNQFVSSSDPVYDRNLVFDWFKFQPKIEMHRMLLATYRLGKIIKVYEKERNTTEMNVENIPFASTRLSYQRLDLM